MSSQKEGANRPMGYGLTAELELKKMEKYNAEEEQSALAWIEAVLDKPGLFDDVTGANAVHSILKDGIILCELINVLQPGSIQRVNHQKMPFFKMENIGKFLSACESYGVSKCDLFQTVDLFECRNMVAVINGIHALGRKARTKYSGPALGPREATRNVREFTDDQLTAGKGIIGLQMGTNKLANAAGINMGKSRGITSNH